MQNHISVENKFTNNDNICVKFFLSLKAESQNIMVYIENYGDIILI